MRAAPGESEPGDDLIEDQRDAAFGGNVAHRLQEAGDRADHPLERFQNDTGKFVAMFADQFAGHRRIVERSDDDFALDAAGNAGGVRDACGKLPGRFGA